MDKKKFLIALIVLLLIIIICCIIKIIFNNSNMETVNRNILTDNDTSNIFNTLTNVEQRTANEITDNITNNIEVAENKESKDNENNIETTDTKTDKSNSTTTTSKNNSNSSNKTNNQSSNNKVNTTTSNKDNSSTNTKEDNKNEEKQENNTDKETEDTEKEEETNTGNEKLANTFFSEYNKQKTQEAVNYINQQMKKDEMYEELGGYAVAVTSKPTNNWMSYSSNSKLDGMALAGCKVSVYVENYYRYNSKGTDYYLYDTKIYVYQEVI